MPLLELLTEGAPVGPIDQALIDNINDAVDVLGLFGPLPTALAGNYTLVYGRKGCGKTAVLSMLQGIDRTKKRLDREHIKLHDVYANSIIIPIESWHKFLTMNTNVSRHLRDLSNHSTVNIADFDHDLIPAEIVETAWINEIWDVIFQRIYTLMQRGDFSSVSDLEDLRPVALCFDDEAMAGLRGTVEYVSTKIFADAKNCVSTLLLKHNISICVLFDSLDIYPMFNRTFGLNMSGFLRAINKITTQHNRIKIVFMLPEELLSEFRASSANILKDFATSFPMRWTPIDLLRVTAYRYKLFLSLHDTVYYNSSVAMLDLRERSAVRQFFADLMPEYIINELDIKESSVAYVLRHTQLLPRHILYIFNKIAFNSNEQNHNWSQFSEAAIVKGVHSVEESIANNILHPYETNYKNLTVNLNSVLGDLPPIFPYGDLHKCVRRITSIYKISHNAMIELLYRIGIIGRICPDVQQSSDARFAMYTMADFYFNFDGNISFSGKDDLCFHPIFSRYYNAIRHRNGDKRIIYPRGINFDS